MKHVVVVFLVICYNLILVAGASYLVAIHNFSPWIYLLALIFGATWKDDKDGTRSTNSFNN
jgi:hypothetical protein